MTLTLRDCPSSPQEWEALRRAWAMAASRLGITLLHWVVEWQERKVPHLHCAVYFGDEPGQLEMAEALLYAWLERAGKYRAAPQAQAWEPIEGAVGWLKYLSKHASRGVRHYQRQGKPEGWEKTGRLWGHNEGWPVVEPWVLDASWPAYWRLRRWVRSWRIANARDELRGSSTPERQAAARRRLVAARRMLRCTDPAKSRGRGISEWITVEQLSKFVDELRAQGFEVDTRELLPAFLDLESVAG